MVVASANEFRINQRKFLDMAKRNVQIFLKRGNDLFVITPVSEQHKVDLNPVWVEHIKKAEQDFMNGNVTALKSSDVWKKVQERDTH